MGKTPNKKIIYIGNFSIHFTTENHIKKSFEALGWEVDIIQEDKMTEATIPEILAKQNDYDFLLYTRTWARTGRLYKMLLDQIKIKTVSFHLDLYIGLTRGKQLQNDSFFQSDYVFSADCGHQKEFEAMGINHIGLSPAVLHESCYLGEKKWDYDVIFVGSETYHTEWKYRPFLINWLRQTYGVRFQMLPNKDFNCIRGDDLNKLYNSAKVIVGDSTYSPHYWSDRIPETLGRGGFLIHPYTDGLEKEFDLYKDLVPYNYGDMDQLKMIIDYYLDHDDEREAIRLHGMETVKNKHTYLNKVQFILDYLGYAKN